MPASAVSSAVSYATVTVCSLARLRVATNSRLASASSTGSAETDRTSASLCAVSHRTVAVAAAEVTLSKLAVALFVTSPASTSTWTIG